MSNAHELVTLAADLERMLKLRTPPIGMKLLESAETLRQIPKLRRPSHPHHGPDRRPGRAPGLDHGRAGR